MARFHELRSDISRLMAAQLGGPPADGALERVNSRASAAPPGPRAVRGADGGVVRALSAAPDCAGLLAVVARDAVDLLTDPVARAALRRCQGEACHRLYLDTSRGGRRRWCSGEVCGNRERVARHRRRTSGSPVPPARRHPARTVRVNPARPARRKKIRPALNEPAPTPVSMVQELVSEVSTGRFGCARMRPWPMTVRPGLDIAVSRPSPPPGYRTRN
ncbi:hypothetical protein SBADM41S_06292 [Streptomyces badius]